ncbi:hypothetical protein SAMN05216323_103422 [Williamwhitmania taraxaci]|uniref:PPIC-type PPIASE domain-containing protein n=2 Tax=Williamwhitmania taraxaci TaxID=1640674 RepID=A0A1G6M552_9BACT|nr:hypothetical protein SAMN05216323_103422 [Williamwhitmania taraxaci]
MKFLTVNSSKTDWFRYQIFLSGLVSAKNHIRMKTCLFSFLMLSIFASCSLLSGKESEKPVAKAYGKELYLSQILEIFPPGMGKEDSVQILKNYLEGWVRKQVILQRAESNLTSDQKNVDQLIEDYRTSLLIYKYEQKYLSQKLDTIISEDQVRTFYDSNKDNLVLMNSIVKALFVKISNSSQALEKVKELYRSNKDEEIKALDDLCLQGAAKYDYFNEQWVSFNYVLGEVPYQPDSQEDFLRKNQSLEFKDSLFTYLLNIKDYKLKGELAPLGYERENIKSIILNQRKQVLIKDLEIKMYNEALNRGQLKVFVQ